MAVLSLLQSENDYLPLNCTWIEYRNQELTPAVRADVLTHIKIDAKVSFEKLKYLKADAVMLGVPEQHFWAWIQGQWEPS